MPGQPLIGRAIFGQFLKKCRTIAAFFFHSLFIIESLIETKIDQCTELFTESHTERLIELFDDLFTERLTDLFADLFTELKTESLNLSLTNLPRTSFVFIIYLLLNY